MPSLRISWEILVCVQEHIPVPHTEMTWSYCFTKNCKKVKGDFFSSTEGKNSSNKWFCVKRRLPSHLKLNIHFSQTVSKAKNMMHWSCNTEAGTCIFTHQPSDWPLDSNPSSCWNKLNQKPPVLLRKGSWPPDNNVFPPLCTRPGGEDHS